MTGKMFKGNLCDHLHSYENFPVTLTFLWMQSFCSFQPLLFIWCGFTWKGIIAFQSQGRPQSHTMQQTTHKIFIDKVQKGSCLWTGRETAEGWAKGKDFVGFLEHVQWASGKMPYNQLFLYGKTELWGQGFTRKL